MIIETSDDFNPPLLKINGREIKPKWDYIQEYGKFMWKYEMRFYI